MEARTVSQPSMSNTISILVTSDNHIGYKETDVIRGDDSWITFDEITQIAKARDVDMILQCGDLFHVNKPSVKSMYFPVKSLRTNCMGDKPCELELLSDPSDINRDSSINYEDPNLNISIPVFAISGNHDDATGSHMLLPLDVLSMSGLVNHFGRVYDNNQVVVKPILLRKGDTHLALYGMQNIKDDRLYRLFRDGNVKFLRPSLQTDNWFNLMCVHQNHSAHTKTSFLPELFLPEFLDFVAWGHEHQCFTEPICHQAGFHTLKLGSSIATSLSDGEDSPKHAFILNITGKHFDLEAIPLKSTRPLYISVVNLEDEGFSITSSALEIKTFLIKQVESLIQRANKQHQETIDEQDGLERPVQDHKLPLIRVKVEYTGDLELETPQRLSKPFIGQVANIDDIFLFSKKRITTQTEKVESHDVEVLPEVTIATLISNLELRNLSLLSELGLNDAVKTTIDKEDKNVLKNYINKEITFHSKTLKSVDIDEGDPKQVFKGILSRFKKDEKEMLNAVKTKPRSSNPKTLKSKRIVESDDLDDKSGSDPEIVSSDNNNIISSDESELEFKPDPPKTRGNRPKTRGQGAKGRATRGSRSSLRETKKGKASLLSDLLSTLNNMANK